MAILASIAGFGVAAMLAAGGVTAAEPSPAPTPSPPPVPVRVLTEEQALAVLLAPADFDGSFVPAPDFGPSSGPNCLDLLGYLPAGAVAVGQNLSDYLFTVVLSGVSSYQSTGLATAVLAASEFVARGCPEVEIDGTKLTLTVSDGPQIGSDGQFMLTFEGAPEMGSLFKADLFYERVGNNIGIVGLLSADEPVPLDLNATVQRFHDKLSAASRGEPIS